LQEGRERQHLSFAELNDGRRESESVENDTQGDRNHRRRPMGRKRRLRQAGF
jgi:hypothetical protein